MCAGLPLSPCMSLLCALCWPWSSLEESPFPSFDWSCLRRSAISSLALQHCKAVMAESLQHKKRDWFIAGFKPEDQLGSSLASSPKTSWDHRAKSSGKSKYDWNQLCTHIYIWYMLIYIYYKCVICAYIYNYYITLYYILLYLSTYYWIILDNLNVYIYVCMYRQPPWK